MLKVLFLCAITEIIESVSEKQSQDTDMVNDEDDDSPVVPVPSYMSML